MNQRSRCSDQRRVCGALVDAARRTAVGAAVAPPAPPISSAPASGSPVSWSPSTTLSSSPGVSGSGACGGSDSTGTSVCPFFTLAGLARKKSVVPSRAGCTRPETSGPGERGRDSNRGGRPDDASRRAFSQILPDEKKESAIAFLKALIAYYASLGVTVTRVMTDNGSCYRSKEFRNACRELGLRHIKTRPYTPRTNGKAERFIQTALREWAYAQAYPTSARRAAELPVWLHRYNWHRPHGSLQSKPPISRLGLDRDNLLRLHS